MLFPTQQSGAEPMLHIVPTLGALSKSRAHGTLYDAATKEIIYLAEGGNIGVTCDIDPNYSNSPKLKVCPIHRCL